MTTMTKAAKPSDQIQQESGGNPWVNEVGASAYKLAEPMFDAAVDTYIAPAGLQTLMASQPLVTSSNDTSMSLP